MKKFLPILFILALWATNVQGAEFLVEAQTHWMDSWAQAEVDKLSPMESIDYKSRSQVGDIIVVKLDGWIWGKEERLPNYVVVKVPGLSYEDAQKYEQSLFDHTGQEPILLRLRKYSFSKSEIAIAKVGNLNAVQFNKSAFESNITLKTGTASEVIQPKKDLLSYLNYKFHPIKVAFNHVFNHPAWALSQLKHTVAPSGGDFTSLAAAVDHIEASHGNLVTADVYADVEISGTWADPDNTFALIHNITVNSTHYLNIYAISSSIHPGYYSNASPYYRKVGNAAGNGAQIGINISYVRLTNFIVYNNYAVASAGRGIAISDGVSNTTLYKMIVMGYDQSLRNYNFTAGGTAINSVFVSTNEAAIETNLSSFNFMNCVAVSQINANAFGAGSVCTNCYGATDGATAAFADGTPTTSASDDGSRSTTTVAYSTSSGAYFTNVTEGTENFHITTTDGALDGVGTNLSAYFTDDIDGTTRSTWDIGVDYIVAAATDTYSGRGVGRGIGRGVGR